MNTEVIFPKVKLITPEMLPDSRGYFLELFKERYFREELRFDFVQINESYSRYGVIRGLHAQKYPHAQAKIVHLLVGKILDVIVDIRPGSPTFGQQLTFLLHHRKPQLLYIPKGFLHGFAVLSPQALIQYFVDAQYAPDYEIGVRFDDAAFNINWLVPPEKRLLSERDLAWGTFTDLTHQLS